MITFDPANHHIIRFDKLVTQPGCWFITKLGFRLARKVRWRHNFMSVRAPECLRWNLSFRPIAGYFQVKKRFLFRWRSLFTFAQRNCYSEARRHTVIEKKLLWYIAKYPVKKTLRSSFLWTFTNQIILELRSNDFLHFLLFFKPQAEIRLHLTWEKVWTLLIHVYEWCSVWTSLEF